MKKENFLAGIVALLVFTGVTVFAAEKKSAVNATVTANQAENANATNTTTNNATANATATQTMNNTKKRLTAKEIANIKLNMGAGYKMFNNAGGEKNNTVVLPERKNPAKALNAFFSTKSYVVTYASFANFKLTKSVSKKTTNSEQKPQTTQATEKQSAISVNSRRLEGYCYFDREIDMTTAKLPVEIPCTFEDFDAILGGNLLIDPNGYALVLKPEYLFINGDLNREVKVTGYVLTADRSSINIADEVNRQYLKKIAAAMFSAGATGTLQGYKTYAENRYTTTYTSGDTIVQQKEYPAKYPLVVGFLSALDAGIHAVTRILQSEFQKIPVIFKIYKGKKVFVNLITEEKENVSGQTKGKFSSETLAGTGTHQGKCFVTSVLTVKPGEQKKGAVFCSFDFGSGNVYGLFTAEGNAVTFTAQSLFSAGKTIPVTGTATVKPDDNENGTMVIYPKKFSLPVTIGENG